MRRYLSLPLFLGILFTLFTVNTAHAHRPATANVEGITTIPDPSTSFAYYEALESSGEVDVYTVSAEAGQFFHAGINIPQIDGLESYGVSLALLGPGLPPLDNAALPAPPHDHAADTGAHSHSNSAAWGDQLGLSTLTGIVAPNAVSEDFFEPFTQTSYWGRQTVQLDLPESGTYYLLVWQPEGIAGKYVMDTGREEVFSPGDLFRFPLWWVQTHIYFGHTAGLVAGVAGLLLLVIGLVTAPRWLNQFRLVRRQESMA